MIEPVGVGILGFGYWGPRLLRNFDVAESTRPLAIWDRDAGRRAYARKTNANLAVVESLEELLEVPGVEAVAIATPVKYHHELAKKALLQNMHVFIEKPFTQTSEQALELMSLARDRDRRMMVDHTFLYTAAVKKMRSIVHAGDLGELLYYDSIRINLGLLQPDVDVIWDLAPHDLSILDYVVPMRPRALSAIGTSHSPSGRSDVAYITVDFGANLLGHFHLNWLAPMKVRQILIGGSKKMLVYNDVLPDEKLRVYDRGIEFEDSAPGGTISPDDREGRYQTMISYRTGDVHTPWLDQTEALFLECAAFGEVIRNGGEVVNDGLAGLRVVLMLEAASQSLNEKGRFVDVDWSVLDRVES